MSSSSPKAVETETVTVTEPRPAVKIQVDRKDAIVGVTSFLLGVASVVVFNKLKLREEIADLAS